MSTHFAQIFRYHIVLWRFSGTWYGRPQTFGYITWAILLNALLVYFWLGIWHYLGGVADVMEANDVLTFGGIFALVTMKLVLFVWNRRQCEQILAKIGAMEADMEEDALGAEQAIVRRTAAEMRRVGLVIGICGCMAAFTHFLMTQVIGSTDAEGRPRRLLVFPASTPYDWSDSDWAFYATNTFQLLFALYSAMMLATLDIAGPHMYLSLRAFLQVLAVRAERIDAAKDEVAATRRCILLHLDCLRLSSLMEEMYGGHYFMQFGASSFGICTSAFVMSQISFLDNPIQYLFIVLCCFGLAAQIFIPCYYGSSLYSASERLTAHIYGAHWITGANRRLKSALMMIFVERAKQPVALRTFAGLFRIELPTFVMVLRAAYSMLSCLIQMA